MSTASKSIPLPSKLKHGYKDAILLQEEVINICEQHDALHILQPASISEWKPIKLSSLEHKLRHHDNDIDPAARINLASQINVAKAEI